MALSHSRQGSGPPLVLVHGLGGRSGSWATITDDLAAQRELVLVDLPGHGATPPLVGPPTVAALTHELEVFLEQEGLRQADVVGSSLGARMALELVRRGHAGRVVALDPGGFWTPNEVRVFKASLKASVPLVRAIQPVAGAVAHNAVGRAALFSQFAARPWALDGDAVEAELRSIADTPAFGATLDELADGPLQEGAPAGTFASGQVTIVWGRQDRVTLPRQAPRAQAAFPDAELVWFERCGHFPHLERPAETVELILDRTAA